jgi:hypothetical protein
LLDAIVDFRKLLERLEITSGLLDADTTILGHIFYHLRSNL